MPPVALLLALTGLDAPGPRLIADGSCPAASQVEAALEESLARAGADWPEGHGLALRLREQDSGIRIELVGADGRVLLERTFEDSLGDCAARADAVGLVVARYLETLGTTSEPPVIRAAATPRPRAPWILGVELGVTASGGVTDALGDTMVDAGPEVGVRVGKGAFAMAARVAWLPGNSFSEPGTGGTAGIDRVPVTLAGLLVGRYGPWSPALGARLVLETTRTEGQTRGLATDTSLAIRTGPEGEVAFRFLSPFFLSLRAGLDVALRRLKIGLRDPDTSEQVGFVEQDLWVPWVAAVLGARWNVGR